MMYRCAHCCCKIDTRAAAILKTPLKKRSELAQMTYPGGENTGGLAKVIGVDAEEFGLARSL